MDATQSYNRVIHCDEDGVHLDADQELAVYQCLLRLPEALRQDWVWAGQVSGDAVFWLQDNTTDGKKNRAVSMVKVNFTILFDVVSAQDPYKPLQSFWDMVHPRRYVEAGMRLQNYVFDRDFKHDQPEIVRLLTAAEMTDFRSELIWAARFNHPKTMEFLLLQRPLQECLAVRFTRGRDLVTVAIDCKHWEMVGILRNAEAQSKLRFPSGDPALRIVPPPHWCTVVAAIEAPDIDDQDIQQEIHQPTPQKAVEEFQEIQNMMAVYVDKLDEEKAEETQSSGEDMEGDTEVEMSTDGDESEYAESDGGINEAAEDMDTD